MISFGRFIKAEREKLGLSQTEFGALMKLNTPLVSCIENNKKLLSLDKVKLLAEIFKVDYNTLKDKYFADKFAKEAYKYQCSDSIFTVAEESIRYLKNNNTVQSKIQF